MDTFAPLLSGVISLFAENPIWQIVGFIAMFIGISGFIVQDDRTTIKIFIASCVFWIIHFIFLENFAALGATAIGMLRLILSLKYKGNMKVLLGVVALALLFWIWSFDGKIISILPLLATVFSSYAFFFLEKEKLRIFLAGVSLMWLIYHIMTGSMSWVINEVIVQITIYFSIYKFLFWREKRVFFRERMRNVLRKKPVRPDFGRFVFLRDKNRFE